MEVLRHNPYYRQKKLDAFSAPQIKRDSEKAKNNLTKTILLLEEAKSSCHDLQDQLENKETYYTTREDEIQKLHRCELKKAEETLFEVREEARQRFDRLEAQIKTMTVENQNKLNNKDTELDHAKLQIVELTDKVNHLINTENQLREKIHTTELDLAQKLQASAQREKDLMEQISQLKLTRKESENRESQLEIQLNLTQDEISVLRSSSVSRMSNTSTGSMDLSKEVDSLRCVLELKQCEIAKMTKMNQELSREAEENRNISSRVSTLENRLEDLQSKFNTKCDENATLSEKYTHLEKKFAHDNQLRTQLSYDKEQLQYQLRQKAEQLHVMEEHYRNSLCNTTQMEMSSLSFVSCDGDFQPQIQSSILEISDVEIPEPTSSSSTPASPFKALIEKPDSVSWVFNMDDETPKDAATRILRRAGSFRSDRHPLCQSASATHVTTHSHSNGRLRARSKSMSIKNSESTPKINRQNSLRQKSHNLITCDPSALLKPSEKLHTSLIRESAGEAMVSSINSEDENCSASSEDLICLSQSSSMTVSTSSSTTSLNHKNFKRWEESLSDLATPMDV